LYIFPRHFSPFLISFLLIPGIMADGGTELLRAWSRCVFRTVFLVHLSTSHRVPSPPQLLLPPTPAGPDRPGAGDSGRIAGRRCSPSGRLIEYYWFCNALLLEYLSLPPDTSSDTYGET
jgi:hypothetical protein